MSASGTGQATAVDLPSEAEVVAFLRNNGDFFTRHAELLTRLELPHASGEAVSLVERQVALLREDNASLQQRLQQLVEYARRNEDLNARIHQLALALMNAAGPQAVFKSLSECLEADFDADRSAVLVFAAPAFVDSDVQARFAGRDAAAREPFAACLDAGETVCGALEAAQHAAIFEAGEAGGSAVVMPLTGAHWDGVLVIASDDPDRFEYGMATDFLNYLKDIVSLVLDPWVQRTPATGGD